jgi:hypothetical protein
MGDRLAVGQVDGGDLMSAEEDAIMAIWSARAS